MEVFLTGGQHLSKLHELPAETFEIAVLSSTYWAYSKQASYLSPWGDLAEVTSVTQHLELPDELLESR